MSECKICGVENKDGNPEWDVTVLLNFKQAESCFKKGEVLDPVCRNCALNGFDSGRLKNNYEQAYGDYIANGRVNQHRKLGHCLAIRK